MKESNNKKEITKKYMKIRVLCCIIGTLASILLLIFARDNISAIVFAVICIIIDAVNFISYIKPKINKGE